MTARAMLYLQNPDALSLDAIAEAAGLAFAKAQKDPETGGTFIELRLGRVDAVLDLVLGDELQAQLQGLTRYLTTDGGLAAEALPPGLAQVRGGLEVAFEPGLDAQGRCERFLRGLARMGQGFLYRDDGSLVDADGRAIAPARAP